MNGISLIYIFVPVALVTGLLILGIIFPIQKKEFAAVQKDIARRKGEDSSVATEAEKKMLQRVTGYAYNELWDRKKSGLRE